MVCDPTIVIYGLLALFGYANSVLFVFWAWKKHMVTEIFFLVGLMIFFASNSYLIEMIIREIRLMGDVQLFLKIVNHWTWGLRDFPLLICVVVLFFKMLCRVRKKMRNGNIAHSKRFNDH